MSAAESQRASFEQRGWCILREFMPPASLAALKAALGEYMTGLELGDIKADGRHVKWAADGSRSRPQLLVNMVEMELLPPDEMRRWLDVGWALLGEECRIMTNEATGSLGSSILTNRKVSRSRRPPTRTSSISISCLRAR